MSKRVMVTGGGGFLGSEVVSLLERDGHVPVVYDLASGGDICNYDNLRYEMHGCDYVIHLAGMLGTDELFDFPHRAVDVNVHGTLNILQACRQREIGFVGITMPQVWTNVYQATKNCAEQLARAWNRDFGVPVSHVRAFNAYGIGQKVYGVQKIVPTFATKAWRNESIPIWGDGEQKVDLVWSGDIAKMLVEAMDYGNCEVFDAGTGVSRTVNEVANLIIAHCDSKSKIEYLPMRRGEVPTGIKAEGDGWGFLDWYPRHDPVEFAKTIDWYKEDRP